MISGDIAARRPGRRCGAVAVLLACVELAFVTPAEGQTTALELVGQIGGSSRAVALEAPCVTVSDHYAYAGMAVIDVSDPAAPVRVGEVATSNCRPSLVAVSGRYSYEGRAPYLEVFEVSDPAAPVRLGRIVIGGYISAVAVARNLVYVAAARYGFQVIDVSDPAAPVLKSVYGAGEALDVAVSGSHVYVAGGKEGLFIFQMSEDAGGDDSGNTDGQTQKPPGGLCGLGIAPALAMSLLALTATRFRSPRPRF